MRVLYVSYQDPFGIGGGSYASHAYLKAFSILSDGNIDIVIAEECDERKDPTISYHALYKVPPRKKAERILSVLTGILHRYQSCVKKLLKKEKYDYVVFSGSLMGTTLGRDVKRSGFKLVTIHHNYEPEYFRDNFHNGIKKDIFISYVKKAERCAYEESDFNLFLTQSDMKKFEQVYGKCHGKCHLIATFEYSEKKNGIFKTEPVGYHPLTFVITGALNSEQGIDGVQYFFHDLYDKLPKDCKIIIAGKSPSKELVGSCSLHSNVELIDSPADMDVILRKADIYICPTRLGGGMKLRIMDGLKHGLPIITHQCSARGYDLFFNTPAFKVFSTPKEFEKQINQLLLDKSHGLLKNKNVVDKYINIFSLEAGLNRIRAALDF